MSRNSCQFPSEQGAKNFANSPAMKEARIENARLRALLIIKDERIALLEARLGRATAVGYKMIDGKK